MGRRQTGAQRSGSGLERTNSEMNEFSRLRGNERYGACEDEKEENNMAGNQTKNYGLNQWERTDKVLMEDFNADNAKIDAALASLESGKAEAASLAALQTVVAGKGNCQIVTGQYIGNGQYGAQYPNSLSFSKQPVLVLVSAFDTLMLPYGSSHGFVVQNGASRMIEASWNGNSVSWYYTDDVGHQMNTAHTVYRYVAFLLA